MEDNSIKIEDSGTVKISDEVVASIASVATYEVAGVCSLTGGIAGGIVELLGGKKNAAKGIKVEITEGEVNIDIHILVAYGFRIPEVAWEIQEKVKEKVEDMTGLLVTKVNIHVDGLNIEKPEPPAEVETIEEDIE